MICWSTDHTLIFWFRKFAWRNEEGIFSQRILQMKLTGYKASVAELSAKPTLARLKMTRYIS